MDQLICTSTVICTKARTGSIHFVPEMIERQSSLGCRLSPRDTADRSGRSWVSKHLASVCLTSCKPVNFGGGDSPGTPNLWSRIELDRARPLSSKYGTCQTGKANHRQFSPDKGREVSVVDYRRAQRAVLGVEASCQRVLHQLRDVVPWREWERATVSECEGERVRVGERDRQEEESPA